MASLGGGRSTSQQSSAGSTFIDPSQQGFLDFIRNQGQGIAQQQLGAGGIGDVAFQQSGQLGGAGQGFLGNLQQGAAGQLGGQQLQNQAAQQAIQGGGPGGDFLQGAIAQGNPFLNQQVQALGQQIGQQFQEQVLPGIRRNATSVGGLGGGRQGVAEGIAGRGSQQAFANQAANLGFQNFGQQLGAAGQLQQNALQGGQLAGQGVSQQLGSATAGLGSLGGLFNLGLAPFGAQFQPLQQQAGLVGGPTVLSEQQSQGQSSAFNVNAGFGKLFTG